jgi:hypothetical protein
MSATALVVALSTLLAACGEDGQDTDAATEEQGADGGEVSSALAAACPERIVFQTSWFPEPEHGAAYQLAGPGGEVNAEEGTYVSEIDGTGVELEIRAGGPFLGGQAVDSIMYQDDDVMFGMLDTDAAIATSTRTPTVAVVTTFDQPLDAFIYDPTVHSIAAIDEIAATGAGVLSLEVNRPILEFFMAQDAITSDQPDYSYDGSTGRFVSEQGELILLGFATNEPYRFEHEVEEWMEPVEYLPLYEAGYEIYGSAWSVTPETLEDEADCLELFVPMVQQAQIDFLRDPGETNLQIIEIVEQLDSFWTLSEGHVEYVVDTIVDGGFVGDGSDGVFGNFDTDRVQRVIDELGPVLSAEGVDVAEDLTPEDLVSNAFIDESITWDGS